MRMRVTSRLSWMPVQGMWGEGGPGTSGGSTSRSCPLHRPEAQIMAADALQLVRIPLFRQPSCCPAWRVHGLVRNLALLSLV